MMNEMSVNDNETTPLEVAKGSADDGEREQPKRETVQGHRQAWILLGVIALVAFCIAFPVGLVKSRDNNNDKELEATSSAGASKEASKEFVSSNSTFQVRLALFSADIANGYASEEELKEDLRNAARFLLNNVIQRNIGITDGNGNFGYPIYPAEGDTTVSGNATSVPISTPAYSTGDTAQVTTGGKAPEGNEFGTNNQEKGVEEGDAIVSDGVNGKRMSCPRMAKY
jgi:hypothetical protein